MFFCQLSAKDVSFFIPQDHKQYIQVDSLFKIMEKAEQNFQAYELKVVRDKSVREDEISIKGEYLEFALKNNLLDSSFVLEYCTLLKNMIVNKENYFSLLLSTLEGNDRVACFNFIKSINHSLEQAATLERKFRIKNADMNKPDFKSEKAELEYTDNLNSDLNEILKMEDDDFDYKTEIKAVKRETEKDTTTVTLIDLGTPVEVSMDFTNEDENSAMVSSMVDFFSQVEKPEDKGNDQTEILETE